MVKEPLSTMDLDGYYRFNFFFKNKNFVCFCTIFNLKQKFNSNKKMNIRLRFVSRHKFQNPKKKLSPMSISI